MYVNLHTKIKIRHNICGHEWNVNPSDFIHKNSRCPKCANHIKKNTDIFKKEVYNLVGEEYTVLGEYINTNRKIKMIHNECKYEYEIIPKAFLKGIRCLNCSGKLPYTTEKFKEKIKELVGDEYEVLGKYIKSKIKILLHHKVCDYKFEVAPSLFLNGTRCPKCAGKLPLTTKILKERIYELVKDEYELISEYKGMKYKIKLKHNLCNNEYEVLPGRFLYNQYRCPICGESKGEQKVRYFLENNNLNIKAQYKFENLKDITYLRFDFGILNSNNKVKYLIEYDGIQHFEWVEGWMTYEQFEKLQYHDQLKNEYCVKHNIPLLRIPYWDFDNIESILTDWLHKSNLI